MIYDVMNKDVALEKKLNEATELNDDLLNEMIEESDRRYDTIKADYDPITGEGLQYLKNPFTGENLYNRVRVEIEDHIIPVQWLPSEAMENFLVQEVIRHGSIYDYLDKGLDIRPTTMLVEGVQMALLKVRRMTDPTFWFYFDWGIKDKGGDDDKAEAEDVDEEEEEDDDFDDDEEVEMKERKRNQSYALIPFKLNFGQLILLSYYEALRLAKKPILVVVCKARQWGASTLTQCYFAWIQLNIKRAWYSAIIAQDGSTARKIKMMYEKGISQYDPRLLGVKNKNERLRLSSYGQSQTDFQIAYGPSTNRQVARDVAISIGTYERPDALPGGDVSLLHYSEVSLWKETMGKTPEQLIKSVSGGFKKRHLSMEVMESTPRGSGNFFQREYAAAKAGESIRNAVFIPWYYLINDTEEVYDKEAFARWIFDNRFNEDCPGEIPEEEGRKCLNSGKYIWRLWQLGATLEGIKWYVSYRLTFHRQQDMASEAPTDDIEAFTNTESLAFDLYEIQQMRDSSQQLPKFVGDIYSDYSAKSECLKNYHFTDRNDGRMLIWKKPEHTHIKNRYLVIVDIGGEWKGADWSIIRVFDRIGLMDGDGKEETVLMWSGHVPHDHLGWKAVQIAMWYDNALLVFESNTLESKDQVHNVDEGDQATYILQAIGFCYKNLYTRSTKQPNDIHGKKVVKYGFHTNRQTKPDIVNLLFEVIHNNGYIEHDEGTLSEFESYERTEKGVYQASSGKHDDRLMTAGIGLYISRYQMPKPKAKRENTTKRTYGSTNSIAGF